MTRSEVTEKNKKEETNVRTSSQICKSDTIGFAAARPEPLLRSKNPRTREPGQARHSRKDRN